MNPTIVFVHLALCVLFFAISVQLTETEYGHLEALSTRCKNVFDRLDKDGDGEITKEDIEVAMKSQEEPLLAETVLQKMMEFIGEEGNESFDFGTFLEIIFDSMDRQDLEEELKESFRLFDTDKNGVISSSELCQMMKEMGEELSDEELEEIMRDKDGKMNYEDFVKLVMGED